MLFNTQYILLILFINLKTGKDSDLKEKEKKAVDPIEMVNYDVPAYIVKDLDNNCRIYNNIFFSFQKSSDVWVKFFKKKYENIKNLLTEEVQCYNNIESLINNVEDAKNLIKGKEFSFYASNFISDYKNKVVYYDCSYRKLFLSTEYSVKLLDLLSSFLKKSYLKNIAKMNDNDLKELTTFTVYHAYNACVNYDKFSAVHSKLIDWWYYDNSYKK